MIHAGIGHSHVCSFLSALGIPSIHHKCLKRMERTIGHVVEQTARDSCAQASKQERVQSELRKTCEERMELTTEHIAEEIARDLCAQTPKQEPVQPELRTPVPEMQLSSSCEDDQISFEEAMEIIENAADDTDDRLVYEDKVLNSQLGVESMCTAESLDCSFDNSTTSQGLCVLNEGICVSSTRNGTTQCTRMGRTCESDTPVEITVSQDAAWSKRGRAMNSLSGWGHVIGEKTRKCLNFSTRVKNCAKCKLYNRAKKVITPHDCRKNWSQSSKSMESDIAVTLHKEAKDTGLK
ncbi:uncharacterized protein LOC128553297 [Mercenaria mercenaria]|uniref:uncharacterized protein LOC128553297 n=1 Tax=Mercenaria mercenaria TaxID=6596 RepID=UPI00234F636B|nr:uncharacterized protein LOC128553297 [Mercenaria mercenaria]